MCVCVSLRVFPLLLVFSLERITKTSFVKACSCWHPAEERWEQVDQQQQPCVPTISGSTHTVFMGTFQSFQSFWYCMNCGINPLALNLTQTFLHFYIVTWIESGVGFPSLMVSKSSGNGKGFGSCCLCRWQSAMTAVYSQLLCSLCHVGWEKGLLSYLLCVCIILFLASYVRWKT